MTTLQEQVAECTGIPAESVEAHARIAHWRADRFRQEMDRDGWQDRFREAIDAGIERVAAERATKRLADILTAGPGAMLEVEFSRRVGMVAQKLRQTAESYDPWRDGSRVLCGPTGIGKTMTGVCVVEQNLRRAMAASLRRLLAGPDAQFYQSMPLVWEGTVFWVRAADLPVARLQTSLGQGEAPLVSKAIRAGFLVLDDLGWESSRAGADDVIREVVSARYDAGRPTLTTSGLTPKQIEDRYSEAFARRLVECGDKKGFAVVVQAQETRK